MAGPDAEPAPRSFEIAEFGPGRGILAFTCVHYTDTDRGVYEETAQAFFVRSWPSSTGTSTSA